MSQDVNEVFRTALLNLKGELGAAHGRHNRPTRHSGVTRERIEAAIERLNRGTFGYCRRCFLTIPQAELLRHPYEERCRLCQTRADATRAPAPRSSLQPGGKRGVAR